MLGVFAKLPEQMPVKTRLQSFLSSEQARSFYLASLGDTLGTAALAVSRPVLFLLAGEPGTGSTRAAALDALRRALLEIGFQRDLWDRLRFEMQSGDGLGARMENAFEFLIADGGPPAMLIGSDSPTLGANKIRRGLELLGGAPTCGPSPGSQGEPPDLVLGPAADGGFWAIGLRHPVSGLLREIPWSSARTLDHTRARAEQMGLRVALLEPWTDVDRPEDLRRLAREITALRCAGDLRTARLCERCLVDLGWIDRHLEWCGP